MFPKHETAFAIEHEGREIVIYKQSCNRGIPMFEAHPSAHKHAAMDLQGKGNKFEVDVGAIDASQALEFMVVKDGKFNYRNMTISDTGEILYRLDPETWYQDGHVFRVKLADGRVVCIYGVDAQDRLKPMDLEGRHLPAIERSDVDSDSVIMIRSTINNNTAFLLQRAIGEDTHAFNLHGEYLGRYDKANATIL